MKMHKGFCSDQNVLNPLGAFYLAHKTCHICEGHSGTYIDATELYEQIKAQVQKMINSATLEMKPT